MSFSVRKDNKKTLGLGHKNAPQRSLVSKNIKIQIEEK